MTTVHVPASKEYDVVISQGLLDCCGEEIRKVTSADTVAVIAGSNVFPLYGKRVIDSLKKSGFHVVSYSIPAGEQHKNLTTFSEIVNFLAENHLTRKDVAVALGGGATGDMTGFAAACYRRGIDYIQMPTTLLSAVDSSVGGKTAVDLPQGKNLVGAFHQPALVLCDTDTFSTLPQEVYTEGWGEIIKYALLGDRNFFYQLLEEDMGEQLEKVIARCVLMKSEIVAQDEFDTGKRAMLNLGHTFGHAVELLSDYALLHGCAVSIGMMLVTRAAVSKGLCPEDTLDKLKTILEKYRLPTKTNYTAEEIYDAALSDKKIKGGNCDLVVPDNVGSCSIRKVPVHELKTWIALGLGEKTNS